MFEDLYDLVGVNPDATKEEIKKNYKKLIKLYHPDITKDDSKFFMKLNHAFEILLDDSKRKKYDEDYGFNKLRKTAYNFADKPLFMAFYSKPNEFSYNYNPIKAYFTLIKKKVRKFFIKKVNGRDISYFINISKDEAENGTKKIVNVLQKKDVTNCEEEEGKKSYTLKRRIRVNIPPHVNDYSKIKIEDLGHLGKNGGKNGNLYLIIKIK